MEEAAIHKLTRRIVPVATLALALSPRALLAYNTGTHEAITLVALHRPECVVDAYLRKTLLLPNGLKTSDFEGGLDFHAGKGAIDEDYGLTPLRHFYNPLTGKGLNGGAFDSALVWAWNGSSSLLTHHLNWQDARQSYYEWLTTGTETARTRAFVALGHVVHLLQDMAQPQHTRDDAHTYNEGAPYEDYCDRYGTEAQIEPLMQAFAGRKGLPNLGVPPLTAIDPPSLPPRFKAFWDTETYTGALAPPAGAAADLRLGLAEYSNAFFVTDSTMFSGDFAAGKYRFPNGMTVSLAAFSKGGSQWFPYPALANTNLQNLATAQPGQFGGGVLLSRTGQNIYTGDPAHRNSWSMALSGETVSDLFSTYLLSGKPGLPRTVEIGLTDANYEAHARRLIPRAALYSAGLLDYFFRDRIAVAPSYDETKNAYVLTIQNAGTDTFKKGTWEVVQADSPDGTGPRHKLPLSLAYPGTLAPKGVLVGTILGASLTGHGPLTLVFHGTLGDPKGGDEADVAVAAKTFNLVRLRVRWARTGAHFHVLAQGPTGSGYVYEDAFDNSPPKARDFVLPVDAAPGRYQCSVVNDIIIGGGPQSAFFDTATVETYLNGAAPVRTVDRSVNAVHDYPINWPPSPPLGLPEGPYPNNPPKSPGWWYVTQILTVQPSGDVALGTP